MGTPLVNSSLRGLNHPISSACMPVLVPATQREEKTGESQVSKQFDIWYSPIALMSSYLGTYSGAIKKKYVFALHVEENGNICACSMPYTS